MSKKEPWIVIGVFCVVVVGYFVAMNQAKENTHRQAQAISQGFAEIHADQQAANDKLSLRNHNTEVDIVRLEYGDDTAKLYEKCRFDPPKVVANQTKCKTLIDKVNQHWAKQKAAEDAALKKW